MYHISSSTCHLSCRCRAKWYSNDCLSSLASRPGSELDKAAQARSTSVYLVDRVIPMLPRMLCEELCSLNPGTDRLAMSIIWEMDSDGHIL